MESKALMMLMPMWMMFEGKKSEVRKRERMADDYVDRNDDNDLTST